MGEDMDGGFLAQIEFIGLHETVKSDNFNDWGHWEQVDLRIGEKLIGFSCETFTGNGTKSFKKFSCLVGPGLKA